MSINKHSEDDTLLRELGYLPQLPRSFSKLDNLMTSMGALYFIGGVQALLFTATSTGGSAPTWSNWIICSFMTVAIAASLAEVCAMYPTAGSIYFWAFKCAGPKWGPFFAWATSIISVAAWLMNCASDAFAAANFIISEPVIFGFQSFPTDPDDINFRAIQFAVSFTILSVSIFVNLLPHKHLSSFLKCTAILMLILYLINMIWLPIAVSTQYGFQTASSVFTSTTNDNGASTSYNWFINILFPMYSLVGFDASGHVAEETHESSKSSANGVFRSALYSSFFAFPLVLMFLFCLPSADLMASVGNVAQPITAMYLLALGPNAQAFVSALSALMFILNTTITILATSRLIFAISRDGIFPKQFSDVDSYGQPYYAVWAIYGVGTLLLLTILPSAVAYNSLVSGNVICILLAYLMVLIGRTTFSYHSFKPKAWNLGALSFPIATIASIWCIFCIVVLSLPQTYPVNNITFNYAPIILIGLVLIIIISWGCSGRYWFKGPVQKVGSQTTLAELNNEIQ